MIVPLTPDITWRNRFVSLRPLTLPLGPVLVVAPHPDDETLGAGGLIATLRQRGIHVTVAAVTDGENAYDTSPAERAELALTRQFEQEQALAILGVPASDIHRFHLTDSGLSAQEPELTARLTDLTQPGMTLLAPWVGDFHPDHEACARAAASVASDKGLQLISYFFWTWHRGTPALLQDLPLRRFDPTEDALIAKQDAIAMHVSQLQHPGGDPILPDRLLDPARWPFEVFLPA